MSDLLELVRATMTPLMVTPAGMTPKLPRLEGIRAVVFDLYGTLLISDAGGERSGPEPDPEGLPGMGALLEKTIVLHHERRRAEGVAFPEVEIRKVWAEALAAGGFPAPAGDELEGLILRHECRVHPVWPMPGSGELLETLRARGLLLGIISNAQFYTLPVMEGLFGADLDELGFHPDLRVFSFEEGEGKPSLRLFEKLREKAAAFGIAAHEILYLGNDWKKDVAPANAVGFRTALFAGDARSLRLGGVGEEEARESADALVTGLEEVVGCLG
jgi:putative hydrolase of the HAD superfamily